MRVRVDQKTIMCFLIAMVPMLASTWLLLTAVENLHGEHPLVHLLERVSLFFMLAGPVLFVVFAFLFVHMGWYPPTLLRSRDPFRCRSDGEKWCAAACYMPLLELNARVKNTVEGKDMVGGGRPAPKRRRNYRAFLEQSFQIRDRESGEAVLKRLAASDRAKDLCWGCLLAGMLFVCKYLTREELNGWYDKFKAGIRSRFSSWSDLHDRYLEEQEADGMDDQSLEILRQAAQRERSGPLYQQAQFA